MKRTAGFALCYDLTLKWKLSFKVNNHFETSQQYLNAMLNVYHLYATVCMQLILFTMNERNETKRTNERTNERVAYTIVIITECVVNVSERQESCSHKSLSASSEKFEL